MSSFSFLEKATRAELATINNLLSVAGIQNDQDITLTGADLDRKAADDEAIAEMANVLARDTTYDLAAGARLIHEASRARRDINIALATHKELLLGSYKTLYQRKLKLEKDIQEERYA